MLFWPVVFFIAYSIVYFIFSQRKMRRLQKEIAASNVNLREKNRLLQKKAKPYYETEFAG
jgi:hypothetical protein